MTRKNARARLPILVATLAAGGAPRGAGAAPEPGGTTAQIAYRAVELCNAEPPAIHTDVVYDPEGCQEDTCAPWDPAEPAPQRRLLAVQGAEVSTMVRYPVGFEPAIRQYEVLERGTIRHCVEVEMPPGAAFSPGPGPDAGYVLECIGPRPCYGSNGECCCPSCSCILCLCTAGNGTCNIEDTFIIDDDYPYLHVVQQRRIW